MKPAYAEANSVKPEYCAPSLSARTNGSRRRCSGRRPTLKADMRRRAISTLGGSPMPVMPRCTAHWALRMRASRVPKERPRTTVQLHQTKCAYPRLNLQPYKRRHVNRIAARFLAGGTTAQRGCRACALCANDTSEAFYGRDADFGDDPHSPLCPFRRGPEDFARVEGDRHGTHTGCHHRTAKAAPLCGAREERRVASHRARHRADSQMSARFIRPGHNRQMGDSAWADRARKDGSTVI